MNQTPVHTCPCAHRKVADHCMPVAIPRIQRCSEAVPSTLRTGLVFTSQRRLRPCFPTLGTAASMLMSQIPRRPHKVADCSLVFPQPKHSTWQDSLSNASESRFANESGRLKRPVLVHPRLLQSEAFYLAVDAHFQRGFFSWEAACLPAFLSLPNADIFISLVTNSFHFYFRSMSCSSCKPCRFGVSGHYHCRLYT
jgi:hypothetical protein